MKITTVIALITLIMSTMIPALALLSKSRVEKVFLTGEQAIKYYFYSLLTLSFCFSVLITDVYFMWIFLIEKTHYPWSVWASIFIISFFFIMLLAHNLLKSLNKFAIRYHHKYKFKIDSIGFVYIIKMLNDSTLLCSKEPNAEFIKGFDSYLIIKVDELNKKQLIKEKIFKPERTFWQKLIADK